MALSVIPVPVAEAQVDMVIIIIPYSLTFSNPVATPFASGIYVDIIVV